MPDQAAFQQVYDRFMSDEEIRPEFLKLYKKAYPKASVPELDQAKVVDTKMESTTKEIKELREELMNERINRKIEEERSKLADFGLDESDIAGIEKIKAEEGVSYESARQLYAYRAGALAGSSGFTPRGRRDKPQEDWRKELKNPESALFKDTDNYIAERRKKVLQEIGPLKLPT